MQWEVFLVVKGRIQGRYITALDTPLSKAVKDADTCWDTFWYDQSLSLLAKPGFSDVVVAVFDREALPGSDAVYVRGGVEQLG